MSPLISMMLSVCVSTLNLSVSLSQDFLKQTQKAGLDTVALEVTFCRKLENEKFSSSVAKCRFQLDDAF